MLPIPTVPCRNFSTYEGCSFPNCTYIHGDGNNNNYRNVYSDFYVHRPRDPNLLSRDAQLCVRYQVQTIGDRQAQRELDRDRVFKSFGSAFEGTIALENNTKQHIIDLITDLSVGDDWTGGYPPEHPKYFERLMNYLKFTWVRLLEERKIICARLIRDSKARNFASERGISEFFVAWNSGLITPRGEPVFFLCVQQSNFNLPPAYILLKSGIYCGSLPEEFNHPSDCQSVGDSPPYELRPKAARYVAPRDPSLLFDDEAEVSPNVSHLIENAARFIDVNAVDEAEFVIGPFNSPLERPADAFWQLDRRFQLADNRFLALSRDVDGLPFFRRGDLGIRNFQYLLGLWKDEAVAKCRRTRGLVVPQFYYRNCDGYYRGDLQLLLPLYCGTPEVKLALTLVCEPHPDGNPAHVLYTARTVLTKEWARGNARLLSCPQVHWINQK